MPIVIHLPRDLYYEALTDLRRPHSHAAERIGFLYGRLVSHRDPLIEMTGYEAVHDDRYIVDGTVGARINGDAIRAAMQGVLNTGDGVFHTHLHEWPGTPSFSRTDDEEMPKLIPGFRAVGPSQATGLFLFSSNSAIADVWLPGVHWPERVAKISIV